MALEPDTALYGRRETRCWPWVSVLATHESPTTRLKESDTKYTEQQKVQKVQKVGTQSRYSNNVFIFW